MNNFPQVSPMEQVRAFGIVFVAGILTTVAVAVAVRLGIDRS